MPQRPWLQHTWFQDGYGTWVENFWAAWLYFLLVNGEAVHKSYSTVTKSAVIPWNVHRDTKQLWLIFFLFKHLLILFIIYLSASNLSCDALASLWCWRSSCLSACGILVPQLGIKPTSPVLESGLFKPLDHQGSPWFSFDSVKWRGYTLVFTKQHLF